MERIPKGGFFRVVAALLLCTAPAYGDQSPPPNQQEKFFAVSLTATDESKVVQALDLLDLEHFAVSELKDRRISAAAFTSVEDSLDSDEGVYIVEVGIDEAAIAERPDWSWMEQRFRDDEILHLELSLSVTRSEDAETLGTLYRTYDYRAEDYGHFSSPQAIRGAVYKAVSALTLAFAVGIVRGDFGSDLDAFHHPFSAQDAFELWDDFSTLAKVGLVFGALLLFVLLLALVLRTFDAILGLFVPRRPAPQVVVVGHGRNLSGSRKRAAVLEASGPEADNDEEDAEDLDQTA